MERKDEIPRDSRGRFAAAPRRETELKRGRGANVAGRPQIRAKHRKALTAKEIGLFLAILAETCNISLSARETGRSARVFYDLRRRDPGFRAAWLEALSAGYDHLELVLLQHARFGTPRDVFHQGRKTATTRVFNDGMALRLLHFHRKTVQPIRAADSGRRDGSAIFDALAARLAEIKAQRESKEADDGDS
jgi:hypothetical protein